MFGQMVVYAMRNILNNHDPKMNSFNYEKPSRKVSPSFKAYYAVGHNKLNIGPNKILDHLMRQMKNPYV
jgi:hypothetical protein